jgi:hypothetical protein
MNINQIRALPDSLVLSGLKTRAPELKPGKRVPIPAATKRLLWSREQGKCGFVDPTTGKRCDSTYFLECDHIVEVALGGTNDTGPRWEPKKNRAPQGARCLTIQIASNYPRATPNPRAPVNSVLIGVRVTSGRKSRVIRPPRAISKSPPTAG